MKGVISTPQVELNQLLEINSVMETWSKGQGQPEAFILCIIFGDRSEVGGPIV